MRHHTVNKKIACLFCSLVALVLATIGASADEVPLDFSVKPERLTQVDGELDLSIDWPIETGQEHTSTLRLPEPRSPVISFVKKCAELDAIPLLEISEDKDSYVFFGIDFEGYLGIHARL